MDRFWSLFRSRLWFYLLLCVLSVTTVQAATRKHVSMPGGSKHMSGAGPAVRSGDTLSVPGPLEGEYIPSSAQGSKGTTLPAKANYDYSIPRTLKGITGKIRGGLAGAVVGAGISYMVDQVGGFIDENGQAMKPGKPTVDGKQVNGEYNQNPGSVCQRPASETVGNYFIYNYDLKKYSVTVVQHMSNVPAGYNIINNCTSTALGYQWRPNADASWPVAASKQISASDVQPSSNVPLTDADYDLMEAAANAKDSEWLKDRLREHCEGALNPQGCFDSLRDSEWLSGPSSVPGPSTTSTSTFTKPDGTTGTVTTTNNTTINIKYGPTYYDYSKTTVVTKKEDGVPVSEETITESDDITEEQKPEEKPEETPAPCVGACDGPAYADQYTPTDQTKEGAIDDYMTRVAAVPIIAASVGFFDVSVGGSCPVWEAHETLEMMGASMPINLVFDFHCASWFLNFQPYAEIIMLTVCAFLAFRIALLD